MNPGKKSISFDPKTLNNFYTTLAENLTGTKPTTKNKITQEFYALSSSSNQNQFYLHKVNHNRVLHEIKSIHSDCFNDTDNLPINLIKIAAEKIASPLPQIN